MVRKYRNRGGPTSEGKSNFLPRHTTHASNEERRGADADIAWLVIKQFLRRAKTRLAQKSQPRRLSKFRGTFLTILDVEQLSRRNYGKYACCHPMSANLRVPHLDKRIAVRRLNMFTPCIRALAVALLFALNGADTSEKEKA